MLLRADAALKRRASAARETPVASAGSATVHGALAAVVQQAQRLADDRVAVGAVPAGRSGLGAREPGAQDGGRNESLADGVQRALGREPRDFADYARRAAATGIRGAAR